MRKTKKTTRITAKQQIRNLNIACEEYRKTIDKQLAELARLDNAFKKALDDGAKMVQLYNKLAGRWNSLRTLVNSND